jgi:hypothetical protein
VPPDSRRRVLLARVHGFIEARLDDPDLSPRMIAGAAWNAAAATCWTRRWRTGR